MRDSLTGRLTLALLAAVAAGVAYPWHSPRERWVLGIAVAVVILLLAWWRGMFVTTMLRRRIAMMRPAGRRQAARRRGIDVRATALLRVTPPVAAADQLPLPMITQYLDRYGVRADAIRVTSRDTGSDAGAPHRETWIGLTISAADNLAALQARSSSIPLHQTAEVAARRLADHLREAGWTASVVETEDLPAVFARSARETWRGIREGTADYVAAYQVKPDAALPDLLAVIRSYPARETWTALEIADAGGGQTVAVACAFRTNTRPAGGPPISGLAPQSGNQRAALTALEPGSTERLSGHAALPAGLLAQLRWPSGSQQHAAV